MNDLTLYVFPGGLFGKLSDDLDKSRLLLAYTAYLLHLIVNSLASFSLLHSSIGPKEDDTTSNEIVHKEENVD